MSLFSRRPYRFATGTDFAIRVDQTDRSVLLPAYKAIFESPIHRRHLVRYLFSPSVVGIASYMAYMCALVCQRDPTFERIDSFVDVFLAPNASWPLNLGNQTASSIAANRMVADSNAGRLQASSVRLANWNVNARMVNDLATIKGSRLSVIDHPVEIVGELGSTLKQSSVFTTFRFWYDPTTGWHKRMYNRTGKLIDKNQYMNKIWVPSVAERAAVALLKAAKYPVQDMLMGVDKAPRTS